MSASAELFCVDPRRTDDFWPHVRHHIEAALKRGGLGRFEDLESDVLTGDALLWIVWSREILCAAVTQVIVTDAGKVCMIQACGGKDHRRWVGLLPGIEKYAKDMGCVCTRIMGRKGWARVLKDYAETKIVLERQL